MAALLTISMTAGCGKSGDGEGDSGKVSITVGNWPNPEANPTSYEIIEKTKKTFMEKYPDVDFKTDEFSYDTQVFLARAEGKTLPTLYTTHFTESKMIVGNFTAPAIIALRDNITRAISPPEAMEDTFCGVPFLLAEKRKTTLSIPFLSGSVR